MQTQATVLALATYITIGCGGNPRSTEPTPAAQPAASASASQPASNVETNPERISLGAFSIVAPPDWQRNEPKNPMRVAQFGVEGETELVVFHFEGGGTGGVEANLARWHSQFKKLDGSDAAASAITATRTIEGLSVTTTDVSGRYVAAVRPGGAKKHDEPGFRLLAAIVQTSSGSYFFKLVGPEAIVTNAKSGFDAMIDSVRPEAASESPHGAGW